MLRGAGGEHPRPEAAPLSRPLEMTSVSLSLSLCLVLPRPSTKQGGDGEIYLFYDTHQREREREVEEQVLLSWLDELDDTSGAVTREELLHLTTDRYCRPAKGPHHIGRSFERDEPMASPGLFVSHSPPSG